MSVPDSPSVMSSVSREPSTGLRCSDGARERGDPLVGTAPPARRWLLIELEGRWLPTAIDSIGLGLKSRAHLAAVAAQTQARIMLIRRVGRRPSGPARSWCVLDDPATATGPVATWGTWTVGEDILTATAVLSERAQAEQAGRQEGNQEADRGSPPTAAREPELLLVCTHGRHDVCCAVRGRPVAAALSARWPEATWECSHTGGDRFAANVLALPDGACYGGLDPGTAVPVLEAHFQGRPDSAYLRGRTGYPPAAQAAVVHAHQVWPDAPWGSITLAGMTSDGLSHQVQLHTGSGQIEVSVSERVREPHQLTCAATTLNRATVPVAGEIRRLP